MNDRFRFRAYGPHGIEYEVQEDEDFYFYLTSDYIVMQCTGLKDKNNKLIYEGDIVKLGNKIYKVAYITEWACFVIQSSTSNTNIGTINTIETPAFLMEVIGNIYENPELLDVKNENS